MTPTCRARWIRRGLAFVCAPFAVFFAVWWLNTSGRLLRLQTLSYDAMIRRNAVSDPNATPVVIVGIDELDVRALKQYPISDRQMLQTLKRLGSAGARTIGIDIYRDLPTPTRDHFEEAEADYAAFNTYLVDHPNVIVVHRLAGQEGGYERVMPPSALASGDSQQAGASSLACDSDGVVRRAVPFWPDGETGRTAMSFGALAALKYLDGEGVTLGSEDGEQTLALGRATLTRAILPAGFYAAVDVSKSEAAGESFQWMLDFRGPELPRIIPLRDVLSNEVMLPTLKDKLVIIGMTAKSVKDEVASPLSTRTYGFVMHGYVAEQMIRWARTGQAPPTFISTYIAVAWTLGWSLVGGLTGGSSPLRSLTKVLLLVLEGLTLTMVTAWALHVGVVLPLVPPLLTLTASMLFSLAYTSAAEQADKRFMHRLMDMHISRPIAEQLLENRGAFFASGKLLPQRMTATVLFSDLVEFTPIAERLDSADLMNWLNEFFTQMTEAVEACGGLVNKFNGDMIMALFGPPRVRERSEDIAADARSAVRCAVIMRHALAAMNIRWKARGLPTPLMRIGIHTGPLVAGSIGGLNRMEYTVIGDTVNTASRLESSNKAIMSEAVDGTRIIVGEATAQRLNGYYKLVPLGHWTVQGRAPVSAYAVLDGLGASNLHTA